MEKLELSDQSYLLCGAYDSKIKKYCELPRLLDNAALQTYINSKYVVKHLDVKFTWSDLSCVVVEKKPKFHSYPWLTVSDLREAIEERGVDPEDVEEEIETQRIARYKAKLQPWHQVT